ncbi:hypothetical protein E4T39_00128 [Aureobasidium subglaciale]|nr:hypothetical protein E4T39_00128 [Aureobasidium subglaciale]
MFCTTLRRRSSFASSISWLIAPSGLGVKGDQTSTKELESLLETHDIAVPLSDFPKSVQEPKRILRLLLLSPNNMSDEKLPATLARIQHFVGLTGGLDIAIILSLSASKSFSSAKDLLSAPHGDEMEGLRSYTRLQAEILTNTELAWVPILPLARLEDMVDLVKTHALSISRPRPKPSSAVRPLDMLAHCTPDLPLPSLAVNLTSDILPSLRHVAQAAIAHRRVTPVTSSAGIVSSDDTIQNNYRAFEILAQQLNKDVVESMTDFWIEDWAVE